MQKHVLDELYRGIIMKLYEAGSVVLIIIGIAAFIGIASTFYLGDDNPVEESAEAVIEMNTGVDIDLSPQSKEKK